MINFGIFFRLAKLEGELAMQKAICEEMKKGQAEMDDYVQELDEDMEGMQSTIYFLQQQFKEAQEKIAQLTKSESAVEQEEPTSIKKESVEEQKEEETASNTVVMKDLDSKSEPIEEPLKKEDTLSNKSESVAADNEEEEIAEDEEKNDKSPSPTTTRGRRGKATPVKESPRRGTRSKRGRPAASEEESPAKGRPKRRRAAAVQKMDETVEEDGDEEDEDGAE